MSELMSTPNIDDLQRWLMKSRTGVALLKKLVAPGVGITPTGRYLHWDELSRLAPPKGFTAQQWWLAVKFKRRQEYRPLPLIDQEGKAFQLTLPDRVQELLHHLDRTSDQVPLLRAATNPDIVEGHRFRARVVEAVASSRLAGARVGLAGAKDMLLAGRAPANRGECMIQNHFQALEYAADHAGQPLTPEIIRELHRILTDHTLKDRDAAGRPRDAESDARLAKLCEFANNATGGFVHPLIRAILLHFMLINDRPFTGGNGRLGRVLFHWSAVSQGYPIADLLAPAAIVEPSPEPYRRAFLYAATDDNDVTYFILDQLETLNAAIDVLKAELGRREAERRTARRLLEGCGDLAERLNARQVELVRHVLNHAGKEYTVAAHQRTNRLRQKTAQDDLAGLADLGLLDRKRARARRLFVAPLDLAQRLEAGPQIGKKGKVAVA